LISCKAVDQRRNRAVKAARFSYRERALPGAQTLVVPTATFRILFGFVVLLHDRRTVVHFNVTANPTAQWIAQQIIEAFPCDTVPTSLHGSKTWASRKY